MNANVVYGVCNGDSAAYATASNYSVNSDLSVGYYGGSVNGGSGAGGGGGGGGGSSGTGSAGSNSSGQASTPESTGAVGNAHYLLGSAHPHSLADPRTPPLTPHDQQNLLTADNGLSYTNLDANGYAAGSYSGHGLVGHHGPPHLGLASGHSQHLPVSSVSVGNGVNQSAISSSVSNPYSGNSSDYGHHGSHQSHVLAQQQQQPQHHPHHTQQNPLHPHGIHQTAHHHPQSHHHGGHLGHDTNGLSAVALPGATPGYGYPDVTQYGARTHPMALGPGPGFPYGGHSVVSGVLRDQCQVNGMLSLAGLGAGHPAHQAANVNHSGGQQQPNVPTYKWMQVKRNVPKPGKSRSRVKLMIRAVC